MSDLSRSTVFGVLGMAAVAGGAVGAASLLATPAGGGAVSTAARSLAVEGGIARAREPQAGDIWLGCNDARAAGTAPIYSGEPGYHESMDGDGDGIACEPPSDGTGHGGWGGRRLRGRRH